MPRDSDVIQIRQQTEALSKFKEKYTLEQGTFLVGKTYAKLENGGGIMRFAIYGTNSRIAPATCERNSWCDYTVQRKIVPNWIFPLAEGIRSHVFKYIGNFIGHFPLLLLNWIFIQRVEWGVCGRNVVMRLHELVLIKQLTKKNNIKKQIFILY